MEGMEIEPSNVGVAQELAQSFHGRGDAGWCLRMSLSTRTRREDKTKRRQQEEKCRCNIHTILTLSKSARTQREVTGTKAKQNMSVYAFGK